MAKTNYTSVDQYLAAQTEPVREVLDQVRQTIRKAVPTAEEAIAYQMPVFKLAGGPLLFFAGWKKHYSLYPAGARVLEAFPQLQKYQISKGTIRFPYGEPVPVQLIAGIARLRAKELAKPI